MDGKFFSHHRIHRILFSIFFQLSSASYSYGWKIHRKIHQSIPYWIFCNRNWLCYNKDCSI